MLVAGRRIERGLRAAPGCERYAHVIAGPREFWTLTIWRDQAQMREWMRDGTHGRVMWEQPHWLDCYWGMRWRPGNFQAGEWEGDEWEWPEERRPVSGSASASGGLPAMPWMHAALGQTVPLERREVAGATGATYRLRVPPWGLPRALRDLRRLRRIAASDADSFAISLGFGTGGALYLLVIATSRQALDRLRESPEHREFLRRWGDRAWWSTWEPEAEFGHWESRKLRDGQLAEAPLLVDLALPAQPIAPHEARRTLRSRCGSLDEASLQVLELLVSELVGNSVRHGGLGPEDRIGLRVRGKDGWIRADVIDRGRRFEPHVPVSKSSLDGSGWGLFAVDQTAERWGVIHRSRDRHVWFELRVPVRDRVPPASASTASHRLSGSA
jgi:anti-sigma regulatory factor (Ser/Thr protein kinase)